MSIWVGIAGLTIFAVALLVQRGYHRRAMQRCVQSSRPMYEAYNHRALGDWYVACEKSLAWSRKRRNKEVS